PATTLGGILYLHMTAQSGVHHMPYPKIGIPPFRRTSPTHSAPPPASGGLRRRDLLRSGAALTAGLVLSGALSACGSNSSEAPVESGTVPLALWTHDDGYISFFTEAIPLAEENSDFTYDVTVTKSDASDLVTKVIAQAVAGTGTPDVAGLEIGAFARMLRGDIASELLTDLTPDVEPFKDDLIEARLPPFSKDGALYAFDSDTPATVL